MKRILCVGVATLDIINRVAVYPREDDEIRALAQAHRVGGNAANTATLLAQLGNRVSWAGNLGDCPEADRICRHFDRFGVDHALAHRVAGGGVPTSHVMLSEETGSRTIVHWRDLPEYAATSFGAVDLGLFEWVHFEGRAMAELPTMVRRARRDSAGPLSLEVEKPRQGIESLFDQVDLLLFSRHYLQSRSEQEPEAFLRRLPRGILATCTWGAEGAWARDRQGRIHHQPALKPPRVVDTLGAGDVFNAGMLHGLAHGWPIDEALALASRLAGEKCGREGIPLG